ncbi:cytochrome o ubiquinol oxidase subunit I [Bartonella tribocorum]|uniref:Cytochrome o ubiquinol oxidase subunit I n=1 Tax=Bartonella tribocorum (strain DSM 28219 / CCUG 45778 / CIP 105476 / IBS 506) TaxID=382640 RepID=A9IM06_BART1|nr:cytochrome o ubiquinol oxidase subunit I [Bartonella tribocorum]CAK00622.1 cytochrome o ubiquinol oxidase subunit I [Bartonella tribocorum CIP 105476]CDO47813.1 cytochrome o ubiquinol oxidase subunit I [Bartonella tribocorum]
MFGRLTDPTAGAFHALAHEPIVLYTCIAIVVIGLVAVVALTALGWWGVLWRNWITTVDHKRIGIMYIILGIIMLVRGFADALMMRTHQALALGSETAGYLPPEHFDQIFSAHGTIMIFFMATPILFGLFNYLIPLQIGARDVAFPFANNLGFWITAAGAILINISLGVGNFGRGGWLMYPPFTELQTSPDTGVDYYLWSLQLSGIATTMGSVNFIATMIKMRAPGMTMMRMPVFCWSAFVSNVLIVVIYPVLTVAFALLACDRYLNMNFFTNVGGGNPMVWINYVWVFGHPEVYVLVVPAFGIVSEVVSTFSSKRLFGYTSMIWAMVVILILSLLVWGHHFFTMGGGEAVNTFFSIATMIIAVPTGVKVFNWLLTMYKGRIRFEPPMLWCMGMIFTFVGGGLTGVLLSIVPADWQFHNSLFLIAHFHHTIIGGVVFAYLAGLAFWFPKAFGYKPNRMLGIASFWCWFIGFYLAFFPVYALGLMGATRRLQHYMEPSWQPMFIIAALGALIILLGILCFVLQVVLAIWYGIKHKGHLPVTLNDSWGDARTLEWFTSSPPPSYNFALLPKIQSDDAYWNMKKSGYQRPTSGFTKIHMPSNTSAGIIAGFFSLVVGFALVWHIWWLVAIGLVGFVATLVCHSLTGDHHGYYIPAEEVQKTEDAFTAVLKEQGVTV